MILVPFSFAEHGKWVKETIQCVFCDDTRGIVAMKDGKPVGAVIADTFTPNTATVHIAVIDPMCLRHRLLEEAAEWLFITCGRKRLIGVVKSDNKKAIRLNKHIGYETLYTIPDGFADGVDLVIMSLKREHCKYLPKEQRLAA